MTTFAAETHYNQFLVDGGTELHAIVRVIASGSGSASASGDGVAAAEVIIIDVSGSMGGKTRKLPEALRAASVAVDCLRDGVQFGVVAGHDEAFAVYPDAGPLVAADTATRAAATAAIERLWAGGGTAIGEWLSAANRLFPDDPGMIRHAILLTDGQNQNETEAQLERALDRCEGRFQCDCRGVGDDWRASELRTIADRLLGTYDVIAEPEAMAADFRSMIERSMGKDVADVRLRLWTPAGATVEYVGMAFPNLIDLTEQRLAVSELVGDYPTGAWGDESRDYHLHVRFPARGVGEPMLAARVSVMVGDETVGEAPLQVVWTDDHRRSTARVPVLEQYQHQEESARLTREAFEALDRHEIEQATHKFKLGFDAALAAGNQDQADRILKHIEIASDGTAKIRRDASKLDRIDTETGTSKTTRIPPPEPDAEE